MDEKVQGKSMKKVLVIAYTFPPVGGGRVRRVLKFVKYLGEFGWMPTVLTVKKPVVPAYDHRLKEEIPADVEIVRTASLEITSKAKGFLKGEAGKGILSRICDKIRWFVFIPDTRIGWIPFALLKGLFLIKKKKIDVIFAMGEPFSSFLTP